ncbi:hypothetical protein KKG41_06280 [Patescibacteria group bacterium]|nr:hypothetical protein [Patescibacteria group bacterium]MBU1890766.1 hypothetical protein [Patescibacteria group bacterium]
MKSSGFLVVALWATLVFLPKTTLAGSHVLVEGSDLFNCDMKVRNRTVDMIPEHVAGKPANEEEAFAIAANPDENGNYNKVYATMREYQWTEGTVWSIGYFEPHGNKDSRLDWPNGQTVCYEIVDSTGNKGATISADFLIVTNGDDLMMLGDVIRLDRGLGATFEYVMVNDKKNGPFGAGLGVRYPFYVGFRPRIDGFGRWEWCDVVRVFLGTSEDECNWLKQETAEAVVVGSE